MLIKDEIVLNKNIMIQTEKSLPVEKLVNRTKEYIRVEIPMFMSQKESIPWLC